MSVCSLHNFTIPHSVETNLYPFQTTLCRNECSEQHSCIHLSREYVWGSGRLAPCILNLCIIWSGSGCQLHAPTTLSPLDNAEEAGLVPDPVWTQWWFVCLSSVSRLEKFSKDNELYCWVQTHGKDSETLDSNLTLQYNCNYNRNTVINEPDENVNMVNKGILVHQLNI